MSVVGSRLYPNPGLLSSGDGNGCVCMPVSTLYGPGRPRPHGSTDGLCVTCDRHTDEHKDSPGDMTRSPPVGLPLPYQHVPQLLLSLQAHTSLLKWLSRAQFPVPTVPTLKSWSLPKGLGNGTWVTSRREWGGGGGCSRLTCKFIRPYLRIHVSLTLPRGEVRAPLSSGNVREP